jgi:hypothetical protein
MLVQVLVVTLHQNFLGHGSSTGYSRLVYGLTSSGAGSIVPAKSGSICTVPDRRLNSE